MGLDAGSSSVKAALGEVHSNGAISVLGLVKCPSEGVRKGNIIDIDASARGIENCLNQLERLTGVEIDSALVGFSGTSTVAVSSRAVVAVGNSNYEISQEDKQRVLQAAKNISLAPDKTIVQLIERQYIVDGYDGVRDPIGMVGSRLEVEVVLIIAAAAAIQNLQRTSERIHLQSDMLIYNQLLAAEAVLMPAEMQMGVILVDFGGGTTEISLFQQGKILFTSVLPVGGEYITSDIAIVLRTSIEEASRIKEEIGVASPTLANEEMIVDIHGIQGTESRGVSQYVVADIISARVQEISEMICAEFKQWSSGIKIPGGIVMTGGGAQLPGIADLMQEYSGMPVRIGLPEAMKAVSIDMNTPDNAAVLGSLIYGSRYMKIYKDETQQDVASIFQRINNWFRDLFS